MGVGAAQSLFVHLLVGHSLHHVGARYKHVALLVDHENEVGQGRRIASASGTRAEYGRELRYDARRHGVLIEYRSKPRQAADAFLYACAARVVQADDGRPGLQRHLLHLDNLGSVGLAERPSVHGEVVGIDKHHAPVNLSVAAYHAVARYLLFVHSEAGAAVVHKLVHLAKRALVEQHVDALTRRHPSRSVLLLNLVEPATLGSPLVQFLKPGIYFFSVHSSLLKSNSINVWLSCTESPSATNMLRTVQSELTL